MYELGRPTTQRRWRPVIKNIIYYTWESEFYSEGCGAELELDEQNDQNCVQKTLTDESKR